MTNGILEKFGIKKKGEKEKEWPSDKDNELQSDLEALDMYVDIFTRKVDECDIKDDFIGVIENISKLYEKPKIKHLHKELSSSAARFRGINYDYNSAKRKFVKECDCRLMKQH